MAQPAGDSLSSTLPCESAAEVIYHFAHRFLARGDRTVEQDFLEQGGLRERMTRARLTRRAGFPGNRPT